MSGPPSQPEFAADGLLRSLEQRIDAARDPFGALADLLSERQAARGRLFDQRGELVLGCRLGRILGAGGMGVTYAGIAADGAAVAVKLVAGVGHGASERFEQECRLLRTLEHPAIVRYRDHAILPDDTGVLVMDRIEGADLERILTLLAGSDPKAGNLPAVAGLLHEVDGRGDAIWQSARYRRRVLRLLADVALGLHAAHERGIVHRDVKPANVLVRDDLSPVLIDFGLARDVFNRVSFTQSGAAMGTLAYMAPEQLGRDPGAVDRRTDVYALGLVLFRALTGTDLRQEVQQALRAVGRPFLLDAKQSRALPVDLQAILYRCLDPRPAHRYPTAAALADDLRAAAGQGAVAARMPSPVQRFLRDRRKVAAAGALLVLLLAAVVYESWPRGRMVIVTTNVATADAKVLLDGRQPVWVEDPVWLSCGTHRLELGGATLRKVTCDFEVLPGAGVQRMPILAFYEDRIPYEFAGHGLVPVQFMTGHQWSPPAPGLANDRRWIDGKELLAPGPLDDSMLSPGRHELRAVDSRGRTEQQAIDVGDMPIDVQLLPAVLAGIDGRYRRTWSTVLSPRADDLELVTDAERWHGAALASVFGYGLMQAPCALVPPVAGVDARIELRCRFPEPMRSAVVWLRGSSSIGGELEVAAGLEGEPLQPWPVRTDGSLEPLQAFASRRGAGWLRIRARMRSQAAPSSSLTLVRMFEGVVFGGHWRDVPPCLAIVADPGAVARLEASPGPLRPETLPTAGHPRLIELADSPGPGWVVTLTAQRGPGAQADLLWGVNPEDGRGWCERRTWPGLELREVLPAERMHPRGRPSDGKHFGECIHALPDQDGDGREELVFSDRTSELLGPIGAGLVQVRGSRDGAVIFQWPQRPSSSQFGDDNSCSWGAVGDWNGDGYPDLLVGSPRAAGSKGVTAAGLVEVVDGRTGASIQRFEGERPQAWLEAHPGLPSEPGIGPQSVLLRSSFIDSERVTVAVQWSVWLGGVQGRALRAPLVPLASCPVSVCRIDASAQPAVVLLYHGIGTGGFLGIERFQPGADALELTDRHPLVLQSLEVGLPDWGVSIADLDGCGWSDAAFLVKTAKGQGVLLVSGRDGRPFAFSPCPAKTNLEAMILRSIPPLAGQPAQLMGQLFGGDAGRGKPQFFLLSLPR